MFTNFYLFAHLCDTFINKYFSESKTTCFIGQLSTAQNLLSFQPFSSLLFHQGSRLWQSDRSHVGLSGLRELRNIGLFRSLEIRQVCDLDPALLIQSIKLLSTHLLGTKGKGGHPPHLHLVLRTLHAYYHSDLVLTFIHRKTFLSAPCKTLETDQKT